jgi:hypothetical protein
MTRPTTRPVPAALRKAVMAACALAFMAAGPVPAPLAAQAQQPGGFSLPEPTPSPAPAPAGPEDERAGVAIPPRSQPEPAAMPVIQPLPAPGASQPPLTIPAPRRTPAPASTSTPSTSPVPQAAAPGATPAPGVANDPLALPTAAPRAAPAPFPADPSLASPPAGPDTAALSRNDRAALPAGWLYAALGLGALAVLLASGAWLRRRRKPKTLRLAAPVAGSAAVSAAASEPPRLDLTLEITAATRSVMMFTINYRLTIANRSDRAVNDLNAATKLACARGSAGGAAGAAQGLESIARIGPHQARSLTGTLQLPLSAIAPLMQGQTPLFIPLVHVTLEGEGLPADTRTFVIGTPSTLGGTSGRVHPIPLDQPPGGIAGLVAQAVAVPAASAAA